jgi:hypothetical protein
VRSDQTFPFSQSPSVSYPSRIIHRQNIPNRPNAQRTEAPRQQQVRTRAFVTREISYPIAGTDVSENYFFPSIITSSHLRRSVVHSCIIRLEVAKCISLLGSSQIFSGFNLYVTTQNLSIISLSYSSHHRTTRRTIQTLQRIRSKRFYLVCSSFLEHLCSCFCFSFRRFAPRSSIRVSHQKSIPRSMPPPVDYPRILNSYRL